MRAGEAADIAFFFRSNELRLSSLLAARSVGRRTGVKVQSALVNPLAL